MPNQPVNDGPTRKTSGRILAEEISEGLAEYRRPGLGLWLSSVAAGLEIGFSVLLMAVMITLGKDHFSDAVVDILVANLYSFGFILVVMGRSQLFTEHTTLAVLPVLAGEFPLIQLGRVWITVFFGNLFGCAIFSILLALFGPGRGVIEPWAFAQIARGLTGGSWWTILLSATLAGWLMGVMGWVVVASRDTISQIVCVWLIASAIGFAHLHHCIVGSVEVLVGVFSNYPITFADYGWFLLWTTLGNILGGVIFVAIIKFAHATRTGDGFPDNETKT